VVLQKFRGELQMLDARGEGGGGQVGYERGGSGGYQGGGRGSDFGQQSGGGERGRGGGYSQDLDD
jgi:single-strand DNA-binding protein